MEGEGTLETSTADPSSVFYDYELYKEMGHQSIIFVIIFIMIGVTGTVGNLLVILAIVLSRKLRSTTNWFVMNLACTDLLTSFFVVLYAVALLSLDFGSHSDGLFSVAASGSLVCVGVSLTTHAFIGFTSWYLITKNHSKSKKLFSNRNISIMLVFCWLFTFIGAPVIYLIGSLHEFAGRCVLGFLIIGHFGIIITVYTNIWRFVVQRDKTMQQKRKSSAKPQSESETSTRTSERITVNPIEKRAEDTLQASPSLAHPAQDECRSSDGTSERADVCPPETRCYPSALRTSQLLEVIGSEEDEQTSSASPAEVEIPIPRSDRVMNDILTRRTKPKVSRKTIVVTKNLLIVLVAFVICFIPFSVCLYIPTGSNAEPWLMLLLFSNSCINPIIYARRIRAFRQVMVCILRCRIGSIPMPIDLVRRMTHRN